MLGIDARRPKIVCLCGSRKFIDTFIEVSFQEALEGKIVLSIEWSDRKELKLTSDDRIRLDILQLRKIEMADEIVIIDVDGYVSESTKREIEYARSLGKNLRWWSEEVEFRKAMRDGG